VENNQWAYSTPVERQVPLRDLADRAKAYGIESAIVDGNDVVAVERTTREAIAHARGGNGPVLIEAKTMRMRGHAQHDAAEYVPKQMLEEWKKRDPLDRYEKFLNDGKLWNAKTKQEIDTRIAREIQADVEFAESSPFPPPALAGEGVYCEGCHTIEADWKRPKEELMPPRSSVKAEWPRKMFIANGAKPAAGKNAPAFTVASLAITMHGTPAMFPTPATAPAAGILPHCSYILCAAQSSTSKKGEPGSRSWLMRSRAGT